MGLRARARVLMEKGVFGQKQKISLGLPNESILKCGNNSVSRTLRLIQVMGYKGQLRLYPSACVGNIITISVRKGTPELRKKIFNSVFLIKIRDNMLIDVKNKMLIIHFSFL